MSGDEELTNIIRQLVRERREQTEKEHIAPDDLAAYHDRALSPQRAEEMEAHLAWCPGCVQALKALEELEGGLDSLPSAAVSDEQVEASFRAALAAAMTATGEAHDRRRRPWWLVPAAGLAAALLLVALILPWTLRPSGSGRSGNEIGEAGVQTAELDFSEERSPGAPPTRIDISADGRLFVLVPWFSPQPESSLLQVTVLDSESRLVWRSKPFRNVNRDHFTLVLGRDLLPERRYTVRIEQLQQRKPRTVGEREIEIVPSPVP